MRDVTVAISSFNTLALLKVVCGAVRETAPGVEILVVDTGSRDGSREWAAARPWLLLERLDGAGTGAAAHGAALDRALSIAAHPILATLDSDAVPVEGSWLAALREILEGRDSPAAACGTVKDWREISLPRRVLHVLSRRPQGREWTYLRPNRALYRVETLRRSSLSFAPDPLHPGVGERLSRSLEAKGEIVRVIAPARMDELVVHLRHATMAWNPDLFPGMHARDVRAARVRLERFLARDLSKRYTAAAER